MKNSILCLLSLAILFNVAQCKAFNVQSDLKFEANVPAEMKQRIYEVFRQIEKIHGSGRTPLHAAVFGNVEGADYINYFFSRIKIIGFDAQTSDKSLMAYDDDKMPSRILFTRMMLERQIPFAFVMDTIIHEAKHGEIKYGRWVHEKCPRTDVEGKVLFGEITGIPLVGKYACDDTAFGAYGTTSIFLINLAKYCVNCDGGLRHDALNFGTIDAHRVSDFKAFNTLRQDLGF